MSDNAGPAVVEIDEASPGLMRGNLTQPAPIRGVPNVDSPLLQCAHPNQPIAVIAEGNIARWRPSVINRMEKTPSAGFPDACNGAPVPKQCEAVARLGEAVLVLIR